MHKVLLLFGAAVSATLLSLGMFLWHVVQGTAPAIHGNKKISPAVLELPVSTAPTMTSLKRQTGNAQTIPAPEPSLD